MVKTQPFRGMFGPQKNEAGDFFVGRGKSGLEQEGAGPMSDHGLTVWPFLSYAEACPAPPAGCPGPSPSVDVVYLGTLQGVPCAITVAGANAGSASVK